MPAVPGGLCPPNPLERRFNRSLRIADRFGTEVIDQMTLADDRDGFHDCDIRLFGTNCERFQDALHWSNMLVTR